MIIHADLDAYYASVEERDRPELVGKPVIVGGSPEQRGVVCAANHGARKYGMHSDMTLAMRNLPLRRAATVRICLETNKHPVTDTLVCRSLLALLVPQPSVVLARQPPGSRGRRS